MEQINLEVPLARLEEDLDDPSVYNDQDLQEEETLRYLPDNLYVFKRDDLGDSEEDKQRTLYLTDDKFYEVKRAYLNKGTKDTKIEGKLGIAVVDSETGNVDYHLERQLRCLGCCSPFRKACLIIKSINGIDLFSLKEVRRGLTFEFTPLAGQTFQLNRSSTLEKVFEILEGPNRMGTVAKRYTPVNHRIRTRNGHYHIKFNENAADLSDEVKYVIVMGSFLLDFLFQAQEQSSKEYVQKRSLALACCC